jgi:hypothetical protein
MLYLTGNDWRIFRPRMIEYDPTNDERLALIVEGRALLRGITGQDFGFDLAAWRNYLLTADDDYEYTDMFTRGYEVVDEIVQNAIGDSLREHLIDWRERLGPIYLRMLLDGSLLRYGTEECRAISAVSGVYHIARTATQKTIYVGQSPNMRSHALGKQVKAIVQRKLNSLQPPDSRSLIIGNVFHVQSVPVVERDRLMFAQYAADHLEPQFEYRAD